MAVKRGVARKLAAAVEGDGAAGVLGQPPERLGDAGKHRRRALVLVGQQEGEPALALHERGDVRLAVLLAEDQQVALPVAERVACPNLGRSVLDPALARDRGAAWPAAVARPAPPTCLRQVAEEAVLLALRAVDVAVDRLVTDGRPAIRLVPEAPGDLLRRPAGLQPLDHVLPQGVIGDQLPAPSSAPTCQVVRGDGKVAAEPAVAFAEAVAAELAVDGRRVPAELGGDLTDRPAGFDEAEQGASLVEAELPVGLGHPCLRSTDLCKGWLFALRDRTHPLFWCYPRMPLADVYAIIF